MSNLAEQQNAVPETVKKESKQYFKITFQDIEIAEEFFENEKHLNEFLIATMNYYRGKESVIKTKIVKKYFETYKKTMNVIIKAREFGKKGAEKRAENQVVNPDTLEGVVKGSMLDPLSTKESNLIKEINESNITKPIKENKSIFIKPSVNEVIAYFEEKGYKKEIAEKAFNYYDSADWKDSKGNKVKNWKQKMNGNWFKDEYKFTPQTNRVVEHSSYYINSEGKRISKLAF